MVLLEVKDLKTYFFTNKGTVKAVDGVSFTLKRGEALGLAGESGCGKSTTAFSLLRIISPPGRIIDGEILLEGEDLLKKSDEEMRKIRWKRISMIFQGAMNALNPVFKVGEQIKEAILLHENISEREAENRVKRLFRDVGLTQDRIDDYPHELSGGMRQRVMIAMALACNPDVVIADEPTTALDATIQAQILALMKELRKNLNNSTILITHDLSIIAETCNRVLIMYAGKIVELGNVVSLFINPIHPYTKGLIEAMPSIEKGKSKTLFAIPGDPPNLLDPPSGCRFHPRCPYSQEKCVKEEPKLMEIGKEYYVACHFADEIRDLSALELWKDWGKTM